MKVSDLQREFKSYALCERGMQAKSYRSIWKIMIRLCVFAETEELGDLTETVAKGFLYQGRSEKGWTSQTFRHYRQYIKTFFSWCMKNGFARHNPAERIEKPRLEKQLPRCISSIEAKQVLYHAAWHPWRYEIERCRNDAIIATFLMTGLRLQELLNLQVHDVDLSSGHIFVKKGKGGKDRYVPIHPRLVPVLRRHIEKKRKASDVRQWFFTGVRSDKQLTSKDVRRICRKVGIDSKVKFTPHMLRHTFAREMIDNDLNLYKLKEIMGHASIGTTQRYLSVSSQCMKDSFCQVKIF